MMHPSRRRITRRSLLAGAGVASAAGLLAACAGNVTESVPDGCTVSLNDLSDFRDPDQSGNVAISVGEAIRRGLSPRAATIALVTAMQESKLYNLDYGDSDSLGLFQQRPSQGWGTTDEIMDPWYSSGKFYEALVQVDGWESGDINDVAQTVQKSNYPEAYAQHEDIGRIWASALCGYDEGAVTSVDSAESTGNPELLREFAVKVWGDGLTISTTDNGLGFLAPSTTTAWSVALLCMCLGSQAGLLSLTVGDMSWTNSSTERASWTGQNAAAPTTVTLTCRV